MAIVKVKYTRSRPKIKAHLRYITHRPGRQGEKISRPLFDLYDFTEKYQMYQQIDEASRGRIFFKIVLSPDPKREDRFRDLDLQHMTRKTILGLQKQLERPVQFIATIHDDHAPHRHVHGILIMQGKLSREDVKFLRDTATKEAQLQRRTLDVARENLKYIFQNRGLREKQPKYRSAPKIQMCPECGVIQNKYAYKCFNCGAPLRLELGARREEIQLGW